MDIIVNISVGEDEEGTPKVKVKNSKTKHGKKSVLELPQTQETNEKGNPLLNMMGI
jgi:hypothetical protein